MAVLAIAGEDVVVLLQRENAADDGRFFADVEMTVAADLGLRVLLLGALLKPPDELHLAMQAEEEVFVVPGQLEHLGRDRAWHGRWGRGFHRGSHLLLLIIYLPTCRGGGGDASGGLGSPIGHVDGSSLRCE